MSKKKSKKKRKQQNKLIKAILIIMSIVISMFLLLATGLIKFIPNHVDVIIDAGHGGYDSGSVIDNLYEKDVTLDYALALGNYLEKQQIKVRYIRTSDIALGNNERDDLKKRCEIANNTNASYYISIHTNASNKRNSQGLEIWYDDKDEKASRLAKLIDKQINQLSYIKNRGIKTITNHPLYVIQNTKMSAILVELGFLESKDDQKYLLSVSKRDEIVELIGNQIIKEIGKEE